MSYTPESFHCTRFLLRLWSAPQFQCIYPFSLPPQPAPHSSCQNRFHWEQVGIGTGGTKMVFEAFVNEIVFLISCSVCLPQVCWKISYLCMLNSYPPPLRRVFVNSMSYELWQFSARWGLYDILCVESYICRSNLTSSFSVCISFMFSCPLL